MYSLSHKNAHRIAEGSSTQSSNLSVRPSPRDRSKSPIPSPLVDETNVVNVVNVVIAKNFNLVSDEVEVQALQVGIAIVKDLL